MISAIAAIVVLGACAPAAWAAQQATATTLTVTAGGSPVTTATAQTVVTLTATVTAGGAAVTPGQVKFCDASVKSCTDVHLLGTAQLTSAGAAVLRFRPGTGSHSYKAVFLGTNSNGASSSSPSSLTVTGPPSSSTTTLAQSGISGDYTLSATVMGQGLAMPTGNVSFLDTSNANAVLGTGALGAGQTTLSWLNPQSPSTSLGPETIAVGDFNGDGIPDLVVGGPSTNNSTPAVTLMLGKGDGTFTASTLFPSQLTYASSIAVGDFNGDGKADLAVLGYESLYILLGNGDGTFKISAPYAYSSGFVAVGDFNGDGIQDLAVLQTDTKNILYILLGNGDGTFKPVATSTTLGEDIGSIAVGDFNGDGKADLAITNQIDNSVSYGGSSVSILLGNGDGTFTAGQTITNPPTQPRSVVIGDFNGDGIQDLAVAGYSTQIFLGNGDGTFQSSTILPASSYGSESSITVGDFNGDGNADLAAVSPDYYTVSIYLGNGGGTFTQGSSPSTGEGPWAIAAGDFNGDGAADLAATNASNDTVTVLISQLTQTATASASGVSIAGQGLHQVEASYPGDGNFSASVSATTGLTAGPVVTALSLRASPSNGSTYTQQIVLTAVLSPYNTQARSTNGEAIAFLNGSSIVGTGTLSSGVATLNLTTLPAATDILTASYAGDSTFSSATSNVLSYPVSKATPAIAWPAPAAITYGTGLSGAQLNASTTTAGTFVYSPAAGAVLGAGVQTLSVTFTPADTTDYAVPAASTVPLVVDKAPLAIAANNAARVFGAANPVFSGSVSGAVNGDTFTESFATGATPASIVGSYPIVPTVTGSNLANYAVTPANGALTITQAGTATTFALSNSNLTMTATVLSLTSGTPTGNVAFYQGQTLVGTGPLANGVASVTATAFPAGDVVVSAQYSGDADFTQSASPPIFVLTVNPAQTQLTVAPAGTVSDTLTLTAASGFTGTLQFSCGGLPADAMCSFAPASYTFTGSGNSASVTMTVQTGVSASAGAGPLARPGLTTLAGVVWVPGLLVLALGSRRRRRLQLLAFVLLLGGVCGSVTACGSSAEAAQSPAGTSTVQVVANGASGFQQTASVTLTVQ